MHPRRPKAHPRRAKTLPTLPSNGKTAKQNLHPAFEPITVGVGGQCLKHCVTGADNCNTVCCILPPIRLVTPRILKQEEGIQTEVGLCLAVVSKFDVTSAVFGDSALLASEEMTAGVYILLTRSSDLFPLKSSVQNNNCSELCIVPPFLRP